MKSCPCMDKEEDLITEAADEVRLIMGALATENKWCAILMVQAMAVVIGHAISIICDAKDGTELVEIIQQRVAEGINNNPNGRFEMAITSELETDDETKH
jgi:hypothetical protein